MSASSGRSRIVGFLGPNGRRGEQVIANPQLFHARDERAATVAGFDVFTQSMEVRRAIGYLPEGNPLYPEMRVREYLNYRGKLRGMSRDERATAIQRETNRLWLGEFIDRPVGQLSKGMKQRVGLADALLHDPRVLILDEPTIGLDPTQIREIRKLIADLARKHTIVLSSHILSEVEAVCQRAIIISGGKVRGSGTLGEIRDRIKGASRLIAEIRGPKQDVEAAVRGLSGVRSVDSTAVDGWNRLHVESAEGQDVREAIAGVAVKHNWALRELRLEVGSLEEFFVQITAESQATRGKVTAA